MADRQRRLLGLVEQATGKAAYLGEVSEEGVDAGLDEESAEAEMIIAS